MECPAFLPTDLAYCTEISSEEELFSAISKHAYDLAAFFEAACDDEIWSREHPMLMRQMLRLITRQFVRNKLPMLYARKSALAVQRHSQSMQSHLIFRSALYYNIDIVLQDKTHWVNSLMFAVSSPFFREKFQKLCWEKFLNHLVLQEGDESHFNLVLEYVYTGSVQQLWKAEFLKVFELMRRAIAWELTGLVLQCVDVMRRYLERSNVVDYLLQAHQEHLLEWKHACYQFFNKQNWGLNFFEKGKDQFAVEFLAYNTETVELFNRFAPWITHIAFRGTLNERPTFNALINRCPNLIGLDISGFHAFSDYLAYMPANIYELAPVFLAEENFHEKLLQKLPAYIADFLPTYLLELDLSDCDWLKPIYMKFIFLFCYQLKKLSLAGNTQLNYEAWGYLNRLKELMSLDLSHCRQLKSEDARVIALACPLLDDLVLEDCPNITDIGIMEFIDHCPLLSKLNLNYTTVTNKTLIALGRASNLSHLTIKGNEFINERGIAALARSCPALKFINVQGCRLLTEKVMAQFQRLRPQVEVIL